MSKRKAINIAGQPDVKIVIAAELFTLLATGQISHVLSWKEINPKPSLVAVGSADGKQDDILVRCTAMDTQGFGYLPPGYPEAFACKAKTTRLTVELIGGEIAPAEEEQTKEDQDTES